MVKQLMIIDGTNLGPPPDVIRLENIYFRL